MITIGLVGGVASGKSVVAREFQKLGAGVLNGDRIGHEVLGLEKVRERLVRRWGKTILEDDGTLNRNALAEQVFAGDGSKQKNLAFLESVTHPEIERILKTRLHQMRGMVRFPIAVLDAAVMLKAGWDSLCDQIIFVDAPTDLRRKRAQLRGMEPEQFESREAAQTSVEKKRLRADIVIDNSGPPQNTHQQVQEVWHALLQLT